MGQGSHKNGQKATLNVMKGERCPMKLLQNVITMRPLNSSVHTTWEKSREMSGFQCSKWDFICHWRNCWTNKYFSNQCICKTTCNTTSRLVLPLLGLFLYRSGCLQLLDSTVYINNSCSSSPSNQVVAHPILIRHRVTLDSESDD